jgi:hypothetical protein
MSMLPEISKVTITFVPLLPPFPGHSNDLAHSGSIVLRKVQSLDVRGQNSKPSNLRK